ncbi:hypothetical protein LJD47_26845, partial [Escherichia coli]|nr:hypothetical protein [Escherichia coli]
MHSPNLDEMTHNFLDEQRIAVGAIDNAVAQIGWQSAGAMAEECTEHFSTVIGVQGGEAQRRQADTA